MNLVYHGDLPRSLFTKRTDVLPQDLRIIRGREIACYNDSIPLKFDRHLDSTAADVPVKFQSEWKSLNQNLAASRFREILGKTFVRLVNKGPGWKQQHIQVKQ